MTAVTERELDALARALAEEEIAGETGCALSMEERVLAALIGDLPGSWEEVDDER